MPRPHLPQRLRPQPAGRRPGCHLPHPAAGNPIPRRPVLQDRQRLPQGRFAASRKSATSRSPLVQGRSQDRPRAPLPRQRDRTGVVAIGVAQEFQSVFGWISATASRRPERVSSAFAKADRRVTVSTTSTSPTPSSGRASSRSAPTSPIRPRCGSTATSGPSARPPGPGLAFHGARQRLRCLRRAPSALQAICDRLGPATSQGFFDRWMSGHPDAARRRRPRRRLLVGAVDAPGRSLAHAGLRRPLAEPGPSSRPWWPTTSTSGPTRVSRSWSSAARSARTPGARSRPSCVTPRRRRQPQLRLQSHSRIKEYLKEDGRCASRRS